MSSAGFIFRRGFFVALRRVASSGRNIALIALAG